MARSASSPYKSIENFDSFKKGVNTSGTDYSAEVLASELIEQGYDPSKIRLIRKGAARRGFSKDIEDINLLFVEENLSYYLYIETNRDGFYDILPEGIFHRNTNKKTTKSKDTILEEVKSHRQEEFFARKFFQLFESEIDFESIKIHIFESKYDRKFSNSLFSNIFSQFWNILKHLDRRQSLIFIHTIPILHKIRNKYIDVTKVMSEILDVPVDISPIRLPAKDTKNQFESKLGDNRVGIDLVLGNTFNDGISDIKITLGPISPLEMEFFIKDRGSKILDELCKLLLSAECFITKEFKVHSKDASFKLPINETAAHLYLGINTFI